MKSHNAIVVFLGCACLFLFTASIGNAEDAATAASQVTSELQASGTVTQEEAGAIKPHLQNMAAKGATKEELKNVVTELSNKGVKGKDLKRSVVSMSDLINQGESPKDAGNVVSQAVAQANKQGLKGQDIAAKVHEAIQQRKAQKDEEKKKFKKVINPEKQEKSRQIEQEASQKGKGKGKGR